MDNNTLINGLIALRSSPGFESLAWLVQNKLESARDALENDPKLTDYNKICLLRGEASAWRFLQQMFGPSLDIIKEQQAQDKANTPQEEVVGGITLGNPADL